MKKVRFFSVAVALVAVLVVSVWAGSITHNIPTLNSIIPPGQTTIQTNPICWQPTANITKIALKGLLDVNQYCKPATCKIILYRMVGSQKEIIGSLAIPCGTSFSTSPNTITLPANTYPANGTYCIAAEATFLNPAPIACGVSLTISEVIFNWSP